MRNKTWQLTSTHTLTLAPPNKRGECVKCETDRDIWLIADAPLEVWHYCWSHSTDIVYNLEQSTYPVKNKEQIVKELRAVLHKPDKDEEKSFELLNYHG